MSKYVVVLGGGESGTGAAILAKVKGLQVFLSDAGTIPARYKEMLDQYQIEWEENGHTPQRILNADEVIKSPGIPNKATLVQQLKALGTPIISEIEFAGRYNTAKTVCITGSNGKTTTTMLTYQMLKDAGLNVGLAGNVGKSFAYQVATQQYDYYVIELSSFQLDNMYEFKADISVLLNITPDHLDRYEYKFQNYVDAKMRITQNQTEDDVFIYWNDDAAIQKEMEKIAIKAQKKPFSITSKPTGGAFMHMDKLWVDTINGTLEMEISELGIRGQHNLYNSMAAALSAASINIQKESIRNSLRTFDGVEHRLEAAGKVRGVEYINDSKATNVNSCWYALESMRTPVVLILGGTDKGNDYNEIKDLVKEKVHTLIFMGADNSKLENFFAPMGIPYFSTHSMEEAVKTAYNNAKVGDTVLLSPCCASFDLFKNYEDRGRLFKEAVKAL
ncbi:MAG: UDP-N-acetylmuramoyl-L-alanine--D-glutamate ligase [Paludibacteraceae bacterium]|jgi:UDP-N-acetylmuramoylalanine--D-glutamate ligase|nr:UDP-N-acetylmuramoyl-L-alanine--D-glutamate ligase [Paludibacteraceae bacterium]